VFWEACSLLGALLGSIVVIALCSICMKAQIMFCFPGVPCCGASVAQCCWFANSGPGYLEVVLLSIFALYGCCPCYCIWDPIPFLVLASVGENVPLHSSFVFAMGCLRESVPFAGACNVLMVSSLYCKLVLRFFDLYNSYIR